MGYLPPSDLAISAWSFHVPSTVTAGTDFHVSLDVYNIGYRPAGHFSVSCYMLEDTTQGTGASINTLGVGGVSHINMVLNLGGGSGFRNLVARVVPKSGTNDLLDNNNTVVMPFTLAANPLAKEIKVLFDHIEIHDGDYVSPKPVISLEFPASASTKGTQSYSATVDGKPIQQTITVDRGVQSVSPAQNVALPGSLSDGNHTLIIRSLNAIQSQPVRTVHFQVASRTSLHDAFNYPNPFSGNTIFTFVLTGSHVPNDLQIKIYTVAGGLSAPSMSHRANCSLDSTEFSGTAEMRRRMRSRTGIISTRFPQTRTEKRRRWCSGW